MDPQGWRPKSQWCQLCGASAGGCTGACMPPQPYQRGFAEVIPKGCICPPTSEKTCQRWDCGRKTPTAGQPYTSPIMNNPTKD